MGVPTIKSEVVPKINKNSFGVARYEHSFPRTCHSLGENTPVGNVMGRNCCKMRDSDELLALTKHFEFVTNCPDRCIWRENEDKQTTMSGCYDRLGRRGGDELRELWTCPVIRTKLPTYWKQ